MDYSFNIFGTTFPAWVLYLVSSFVPAVITLYTIPVIVRVSSLKKLFDLPNGRDSHTTSIPALGGLAIFAAFSMTSIIFSLPSDSTLVKYILGAIIVLFFTGMKDDILILDPLKKLFLQIIAVSIIVLIGDMRITTLHSIFGVGEISYVFSCFFSFFLIATLINGFNLIDGIDGLASAVGIVSTLFMGICFAVTGETTLAVMCFALIGSLIAFFVFNVFGKENKIFMGDTGSMIIGLLISVFTIKFLEKDVSQYSILNFSALPAIAFSLLIIPLFDTLRVFTIRIMKGGSPFIADKNHLHHSLLKFGLSHVQVTSIMISINLMLLLFVILFQSIGSFLLIIILLTISTLLSFFLAYKIRRKTQEK